MRIPRGSGVKNPPTKQCRQCGFYLPLGQGDPLEKEVATHSYSCLENPMDRGAWWPTIHGVPKESDTTWQINDANCRFS